MERKERPLHYERNVSCCAHDHTNTKPYESKTRALGVESVVHAKNVGIRLEGEVKNSK